MKTGGWRHHEIVCSLDASQQMGAPVFGAYQAAGAGIEWGAYQVLQNAAGAFATGCQLGPTAQNLAPLPNTLAGFNVNVICTSTPYIEAAVPVTIYQLTSTAKQGTVGTPDYVEREMTVTIAQ